MSKIVKIKKQRKFEDLAAAGIMFCCSEDNTILLLLRAPWVNHGLTWSISGGGIDNKDATIPGVITQELLVRTAFRETLEECGSLPPDFSSDQIFGHTLWQGNGFMYLTLIADLTLEQKLAWQCVSYDNENVDFRWFPTEEVLQSKKLDGRSIHFGVKFTLKRAGMSAEPYFDDKNLS